MKTIGSKEKTIIYDLLTLIEKHDKAFREKICSKCSSEMRKKRNCEEEIPNRTFCEKLVKYRNRNELIQRMEKELNIEILKKSPFALSIYRYMNEVKT